jgi:hypothetical protein
LRLRPAQESSDIAEGDPRRRIVTLHRRSTGPAPAAGAPNDRIDRHPSPVAIGDNFGGCLAYQRAGPATWIASTDI